MIGIAAFVVAFIMVAGPQPQIAKAKEQEEFTSDNQLPTEEEVTVNLKETLKGEYGHETVTHYEGNGINSVVVDKSEYTSAKAFVADLDNLLNENTADRVRWDSKFEKEKYYSDSIIVYVNHFVNNGSVTGEKEI